MLRPASLLSACTRPLAAALAASLLLAAPAGAAKFAGAFMEDGGGARALAMGGAFVAIADDPSAVFWNPAGLSGRGGRELLLMHSERFGDLVDRDFASYVQPVSWSLLGGEDAGFGLSVIRLGVDDIQFTDHLKDRLDTDPRDGVVSDEELLGLFDLQNEIRYVSDSELAFFVSYAERHGEWRLGGSLKFIRQNVGDYSSLGLGFDFALLRPDLWRGLDFGVKFQDVTTTFLSWDSPESVTETIYPAIVPGFAYRVDLPDLDASLRLAVSFDMHFDNRRNADQYWGGAFSANQHTGVEVGFRDRVFLRGGFDSGWEGENLTAGAGFRLDRLTVDYAYAGDILEIDEDTHRISVTARF